MNKSCNDERRGRFVILLKKGFLKLEDFGLCRNEGAGVLFKAVIARSLKGDAAIHSLASGFVGFWIGSLIVWRVTPYLL